MAARAIVLKNFVRHCSMLKRKPRSWQEDAVKYEAVTYYPRHPNHVDPPFTPSKLLLVKRVKPFRGNPYWEKDILKKSLGFKIKSDDPVIVKNTPEMCNMLWKVKHLVSITPIKLPDKLPTSDDLNGTYLHENGTFYVIPKVDSVRYDATEKFINNPKKMNRDEIMEKLRLKWLEGRPM